jgi:hypothetical protein
MRRPRITRFGGVAALLVLVSCTELAEVELGQGEAGATCAQVSDCRAGLLCTDDVCTPIEGAEPASARGQACGASAPCPSGLCCGSQAVCRPVEASFAAGMCGGSVGSGCGFTADCAPGLVCTSAGECAAPDGEGTGGLGASCAELSDCRRPLVCGLAKTCERLPFFAGVSCTRSEEEVGAFRMYFEVPGSAPLDEFFRHPFPSDVRRGDDGHPILDGYPSPGEVLGIDFTRLYVDAIEQDTDGFALTAPVFTQWSDALDPRTLSINTATATVYLVDVATDTRVPLQLGLKTERGQLTCANTVAVAPLDGVALAPRTTYALVFEAGIRSRRGEAPIQDAALAALLAEATPSAPELARAHARYAPLRSYLAARGCARGEARRGHGVHHRRSGRHRAGAGRGGGERAGPGGSRLGPVRRRRARAVRLGHAPPRLPPPGGYHPPRGAGPYRRAGGAAGHATVLRARAQRARGRDRTGRRRPGGAPRDRGLVRGPEHPKAPGGRRGAGRWSSTATGRAATTSRGSSSWPDRCRTSPASRAGARRCSPSTT